MTSIPFHLGLLHQGSSVQAWGEPWTGRIAESWMVPELFVGAAKALERACFDHILPEESSYIGESSAGSREIYLHHGMAVPRQDPSVVATFMMAATSRTGIVPTFATSAYPTYLLARLMASLDHISSGRAVMQHCGAEDGNPMSGLRGLPHSLLLGHAIVGDLVHAALYCRNGGEDEGGGKDGEISHKALPVMQWRNDSTIAPGTIQP